MLCAYEKTYYANAGFVIAGMRVLGQEPIIVGDERVIQFSAKGYGLPDKANKMTYEMEGEWRRDPKYGLQFAISTCYPSVEPTRAGIITYLTKCVKGVGDVSARQIYQKFGNTTLDVLDHNPDRLLEIPGIGENKLRFIKESIAETRGAREIIEMLTPPPLGISIKKCLKIYEKYGKDAVSVIRDEPYSLLVIQGISFDKCDLLAKHCGISPHAPERLKAALLFTLEGIEQDGHLCITWRDWVNRTVDLLKADEIMPEELYPLIQELADDKKIKVSLKEYVYSYHNAMMEHLLAHDIARLHVNGEHERFQGTDLGRRIRQAELMCHVTLAEKQREAVKCCLNAPISIITGGPGTGKTTILRVVIQAYMSAKNNCDVLLMAPTGKAARRMSEATGLPAQTINSAIGLKPGYENDNGPYDQIEADLIVIDETSMLDIRIAWQLFKRIKTGTKTILVGDVDQLPSVGPGAVLSEMIQSEMVPTVKLTEIYRQASTSHIVTNAVLIRDGQTQIEYGDEDFIFIEAETAEESAAIIESQYLNEIQAVGVENVVALTPYREKTDTGASALAVRLRDAINPAASGKKELKFNEHIFRIGDRVMQTKNIENACNGDVGTVVRIGRHDGIDSMVVDFGGGRQVEYLDDDLQTLRLAYACTIHKSQGSEYETVFISLLNLHKVMLQRNLVYTAVTRAKKKVVFVGQKQALMTAIRTNISQKRLTLLARRIIDAVTTEQRRKAAGTNAHMVSCTVDNE